MQWKIIPGFPDYEVSEHGNVRRGERQLMPERVNGSGRKRYTLSKNKRSYRVPASHLVALAFIGPKPFEGAEVCHNDSFFHNNHFTNLRWDNHSANIDDAVKHRHATRNGLSPTKQKLLSAAADDFLAMSSRRS